MLCSVGLMYHVGSCSVVLDHKLVMRDVNSSADEFLTIFHLAWCIVGVGRSIALY